MTLTFLSKSKHTWGWDAIHCEACKKKMQTMCFIVAQDWLRRHYFHPVLASSILSCRKISRGACISIRWYVGFDWKTLHSAIKIGGYVTHCNALHHTKHKMQNCNTRCNTNCNTHCNTHCNTLEHTGTHIVELLQTLRVQSTHSKHTLRVTQTTLWVQRPHIRQPPCHLRPQTTPPPP